MILLVKMTSLDAVARNTVLRRLNGRVCDTLHYDFGHNQITVDSSLLMSDALFGLWCFHIMVYICFWPSSDLCVLTLGVVCVQ